MSCRDGNKPTDCDRIIICRSKFTDRTRYACPHGHTVSSWKVPGSAERIWCRGCRRLVRDDDAELRSATHYQIVDRRTGKTIPIQWVEIVD